MQLRGDTRGLCLPSLVVGTRGVVHFTFSIRSFIMCDARDLAQSDLILLNLHNKILRGGNYDYRSPPLKLRVLEILPQGGPGKLRVLETVPDAGARRCHAPVLTEEIYL